MHLKIYCDGGARGNPGPAALGVVIKDEKGSLLEKFGRGIGETTNNVAEYEAVLAALSWIRENARPLRITFYLDSKLVVSQLSGIFKTKDTKLRALLMKVRELEGEIGGNVSYIYIAREENREADQLVNEVLDKVYKSKA